MTATTSRDEVYIEAHHVQRKEAGRDIRPTGHERVASFNLIKDKSSLVVPGHPPVLLHSRLGERFRLKKDTAIEENAEEGRTESDAEILPLTRGQSLFKALKLCSPEFDIGSVDFVADIRTIRQLINFCRSRGDSDGERAKHDIGGWKFLIYDVNASGHKLEHGTQEQIIPPTIVFTRAGPIMDGEDAVRLKNKSKTCYFSQYRHRVTTREAGSPSGASKRLSLVTKVNLDDLKILVQTDVHAVERAPSSAKENRATTKGGMLEKMSTSGEVVEQENTEGPVSNLCPTGPDSKSDDPSDTGAKPRHIESGSMLGATDTIVELLTCNSWYTGEIEWRSNYWHNAFAGSDKLVIGRHNRGLFNANRKNKALHLSASEVESRAAREGSLSLDFLVDILREIGKTAKTLLPTCPVTNVDGARRQAAVVDFLCSPQEGACGRRIRLRPYDG